MMDGTDLFRKLCVGAKFDFKKYSQDAERLKVILPNKRDALVNKSPYNHNPIPKKNDSCGKRKVEEQRTTDLKRKKIELPDEDDSDSDDDSDDGGGSSSKSGSVDSDSDDDMSCDSEEGSNTLSDSSCEEELQLLGNITSRERESVHRIQKKTKKKTKEKLLALKLEEISRVRNQNKIHYQGTDVPDPLRSFKDLQTKYNIHPQIISNIDSLRYKVPTPIQMQAIPAMLNRRELMACAPTGSGKTAAFIIPILHHLKGPSKQGPRALVLAPTRELANQIYREFERLSEGMGFRINYMEISNPEDKHSSPNSMKKFDIVVSTPNRLVYMLKQEPPVLNLKSIEWLVIDESDKLFEDGKTGFREQLATIYKACDGANTRRAMFSATFAYDVEEWCKLNLDNVIHVYIGSRNSATQTIEQELKFVGTESGKLYAVRDIIRKGVQPPILVFVQSKERAKELFHELIYDGLNVDIIHSDRTQQERDNVVKCFRLGKIWILICTELMGRGIDFKGVNLVINFDFPNSAVSYIHRIGRTGRAGRPGRAVTFFTEDDVVNLRSIANVMVEAGCPVPDYMLKIKRPSKKIRRKLAKRIPVRERISTISQYDLEKAKRRRNIILKQKEKQTTKKNNNKKAKGKLHEKVAKDISPDKQNLHEKKHSKGTFRSMKGKLKSGKDKKKRKGGKKKLKE